MYFDFVSEMQISHCPLPVALFAIYIYMSYSYVHLAAAVDLYSTNNVLTSPIHKLILGYVHVMMSSFPVTVYCYQPF